MRIRRPAPLRFETLEQRVYLSAGAVYPGGGAQAEAAKASTFDGTLYVVFSARAVHGGIIPYRFIGEDGAPFKPMGNHVTMSGPLGHSQLLSSRKLPNLSDSILNLTNAKGGLTVSFASSTTNRYSFTISGGTNHFVTEDGITGSAVFTNTPNGYQIKFKSDNRPSS
jgi:hypothetical protein